MSPIIKRLFRRKHKRTSSSSPCSSSPSADAELEASRLVQTDLQEEMDKNKPIPQSDLFQLKDACKALMDWRYCSNIRFHDHGSRGTHRTWTTADLNTGLANALRTYETAKDSYDFTVAGGTTSADQKREICTACKIANEELVEVLEVLDRVYRLFRKYGKHLTPTAVLEDHVKTVQHGIAFVWGDALEMESSVDHSFEISI